MTVSSKLRHLRLVIADTRWWPFYLQRRFMQAKLRDRLAGTVATHLRPRNLAGVPVDASAKGALNNKSEELATKGISHFGQLLSKSQTSELVSYFLARQVHDSYRSETTKYLPDSDARHPYSHIAHHEARDILLAPYLLEIVNRPDVLAVVGEFLGCKPTLGYLAAWWSYPTALGAQQAEHFHRDVDDWRFVKLFIYLTDVGAQNGPHVYITRSANAASLREIRRFDDQEVIAAMGPENMLTITGQAGEGFLENTFGIHKGQPVAEGRRLIFQAVYSMFPLPYGPKEPVATISELANAGASAFDAWSNRLYIRSA